MSKMWGRNVEDATGTGGDRVKRGSPFCGDYLW